MSDQSAEAEPSDHLRWNLVWRLNILWDRVGGLLAIPAELAGANLTSPIQRRLLFTVALIILIVPALLYVPWIPSLESFRTHVVNSLPVAIAGTVFSPAVIALLVSAFIGLILSINRAWSINEVNREIRVYKDERLSAAEEPPDLRYDGLITAALLLPAVPLWLSAVNKASCQVVRSCLYSDVSSYFPWSMYALHSWLQTIIPVRIPWNDANEIVAINPGAAFLNIFVSYLVSGVFLFSAFEWYRLSRVSAYAIDALDRTPDRAVAIGSRIIPQLRSLFSSGEKYQFSERFYKNTALALGEISSRAGLDILTQMTVDSRARVRNRAVQGIDDLFGELSDSEQKTALGLLQKMDEQESSTLVKSALRKAIERHSPKADLRAVAAQT